MTSITEDFLDPPRQKNLPCFCQDKFKTKMDKKSRFVLGTKTGGISNGKLIAETAVDAQNTLTGITTLLRRLK